MSRASELLQKNLGSDGAAIPPGTLELIIGIISTMITLCKNRGSSETQMAAMVRKPSPAIKMRFRRRLMEKLGKSEYKNRGGSKYADKVFAAGAEAKVAEAKAFVKEITS